MIFAKALAPFLNAAHRSPAPQAQATRGNPFPGVNSPVQMSGGQVFTPPDLQVSTGEMLNLLNISGL